ncbi:MAG: KOW domain-containing RNA-binding protein [Oscillospiraceae bacterium]|nr:KOW domain-containing RNA-binding protein [Oscillospiraceae bacterium]
MWEIGTVAVSTAGRDKGYLLCVVGRDGKAVLVCDGKERRLERPKRKNPRHITPLEGQAPFGPEQLRGNKALRRALNSAREARGKVD